MISPLRHPLCSECAAIEYSKEDELVVVPGTWHGKFKKEWPTKEERLMTFICGDDIASLIKRFENESK